MLDIRKIRHLAEFTKDYEIFKEALQKRIEAEARAGKWQTEVTYINGGYTVWNFEVVNMAVEELRKDGFNVEYIENPVVMEKYIVIDWIEPYADTDSVKLPESCPEVAPELPQVCQNCKWFLHGLKKCQLKDIMITLDPACIGCGLYESED